MPIPTKEPMLLDREDAPPALPVRAQEPSGDAFMLMLERLAKDPTADVEKMERIIAMQERILRHNAKAAYDAAFAEMQPNLPIIAERKRTDKSTYAPLEDIVEVVRPILARFKFSLNHSTEWPDKLTVKVTGRLKHVGGHSEQSEFVSGADTSGSKNGIQALASAVSYGKRYTTKDLLLIVTREEDNDGRTAEKYKQEAPDPDGYDDWKGDMEAVAAEGLPKLMATWNKSAEHLRKRVAKVDLAWWENLRTKAGQARGAR